ncbi:MAG: RecX family transcriptional regulator [Chloroflexota bacterium]
MSGKITALEIQKRNKERVNVYIEGEFAFGLNLMDAVSLRKGQELTEADITALKDGDAIVRAVDAAANFLSYRPRSSREVRDNLNKKDYPPTVIDAAMERLRTMGYLDDEAFARFWVENRDTFKPRSPMALAVELRQKGVPDDIIQRVIETVDATDAAYRAAQKKLNSYRGHSVQDFKKKLGSYLQRRGFGYEVVNDVFDRLIEELNETDPDYFAADEPPY